MFSKALLIFSLVSVAFATVSVTNPVAATTDTGGQAAKVEWRDDGNSPSLQQFGNATISIYVGNPIQQTRLQILSNGTDVSTVTSLSFTPDPTIGPNDDKYFIRFESISGKDSTGTPYESFSALFTLNGMTGTFSASVSAEIAGLSTASFGGQTTASPSSTSGSSLTTSLGSNKPSSASSSTSATAKPSSGAMGLKAGWAGMVFGAVVGVTLF